MYLLIYIQVKFFSCILTGRKDKAEEGTKQVLNYFEWNGVIRVFSVAYIKLAIFAFLQLFNISYESQLHMISTGLAYFVIFIVVILPYIVYRIINVSKVPRKKYRARYSGLFSLY